MAFHIAFVLRSGTVAGPFTSCTDSRFAARGRALVFSEETPAFMFWCCWREPKVRVVVLQREATSGAKWLCVSRFVPHSIVSRLRVNPETCGRLEGARRTLGADTWNLPFAWFKKNKQTTTTKRFFLRSTDVYWANDWSISLPALLFSFLPRLFSTCNKNRSMKQNAFFVEVVNTQ